MSKKVIGGYTTERSIDIKVGEVASVVTQDGMWYVFHKPEWADKWYFSHRITEGDNGETVTNSANRMLPQKVVAWANRNLGIWDFYEGKFGYSVTQGINAMLIEESSE